MWPKKPDSKQVFSNSDKFSISHVSRGFLSLKRDFCTGEMWQMCFYSNVLHNQTKHLFYVFEERMLETCFIVVSAQ